MGETSGRVRVVGSTVVVTLAVWFLFSSINFVWVSPDTVGIVAAAAFVFGLIGSTPRMLRREPLATMVMVALACVPWLGAMLLPEERFDPGSLNPDEVLRIHWLLVLEHRGQGAVVSAGLLCAEALTQTRLTRGAPARHRLVFTALLVLPLQTAWWHLAGDGLLNENSGSPWVIVPVVSTLIVSLAIWSGSRRAIEVVATLTLAHWASMAVISGALREQLTAVIRCGPAPRGVVAAGWFREDFPHHWLELAPWAALLSLGLALVVFKPTRALMGIVVIAALVVTLDGAALVTKRRALPEVETLGDRECEVMTVNEPLSPAVGEQASARARPGARCVLVYSRTELLADQFSFNALDHVRAIERIEPIYRPR